MKLLQSEMIERKNVSEVSREGHMDARERLIKELEQSARRAQQVLLPFHYRHLSCNAVLVCRYFNNVGCYIMGRQDLQLPNVGNCDNTIVCGPYYSS